jgi:hypothetical protein
MKTTSEQSSTQKQAACRRRAVKLAGEELANHLEVKASQGKSRREERKQASIPLQIKINRSKLCRNNRRSVLKRNTAVPRALTTDFDLPHQCSETASLLGNLKISTNNDGKSSRQR